MIQLRHILLSLLFYFSLTSFGQNFSFTQFENEKDSILRSEMAIESWNYYSKNDLDSLRIVGLHMINTDSSNLYVFGLRNIGSFHIRGNSIEKGIKLLNEAREIFIRKRTLILLSEIENELGNAFYLRGNYSEALDFYLASMSHGSYSSDNTASYNGMLGFGKTMCAAGDTARGLLFIQKFLSKCLQDEKYESAADACGYLGMIAGNMGKVELMSAYYRRGVLYSKNTKSIVHRANALTNKAIDYFYHDQVDSAIYLFQQSLKIRQQVGACRPIVESYYNLAILNIELGDFVQAKMYAEKGEKLSSEKGIRSWQLDCLELLLEIAQSTGNKTNIESIKFDIERIKGELKQTSKLDNEIIELAVQLTSLKDKPETMESIWETASVILIVLTSGIVLYSLRAS